MLQYQDTPLIELQDDIIRAAGIRLLIKREDQNHPSVSGNKWWKLKYNLDEAIRSGHHTLLTFGGAYSNHIYAVAAAAHELGLKSIGIIRGEENLPRNHTLAFARDHGMILQYISRELYRQKNDDAFITKLHDQFGGFYLLPEGGTNDLALKGCSEFATQIKAQSEFDYLCLPVGTGGTMAGMIAGLKGGHNIIGFSVLKNGTYLQEEVSGLLKNFSPPAYANWQIEMEYHFGGYAKKTRALDDFISFMWGKHHLPLEPVYTGKMMFGVYDMMLKGRFNASSTVMILHTGGLQGQTSLSE